MSKSKLIIRDQKIPPVPPGYRRSKTDPQIFYKMWNCKHRETSVYVSDSCKCTKQVHWCNFFNCKVKILECQVCEKRSV